MFLQLKLAMIVGIAFMAEEASGLSEEKLANNPGYLGSEPSKAYYFPWLVTFHRESGDTFEFFGSGSILTHFWVISSMDSFIRRSKFLNDPRSFYQVMDELFVYSSGVWGNQFVREPVGLLPNWFQKRRVSEIRMFTHPHTIAAQVATFSRDSEPSRLNDWDRSPFGFSMSICLVKVSNYGGNREAWDWKSLTLPIPLFADTSEQIKTRMTGVVEHMEKMPLDIECYAGGFRLADYRLVQRKVVYVPFEDCESIYCSYDKRACVNWPVKGTHVCFKSVTYDDMCWIDQGTALYCKGVSESVIAILTSGPTCGYGGLPGVYTLIHHALELHERVDSSQPYHKLSEESLTKYTPPPVKFLIPLYR